MTAPSTPVRFSLLVGAIVLVASLLAFALPLPIPVAAAIPTLAAALACLLPARAAERERALTRRGEADAAAALQAAGKAGSQLRHDLRGILSPALLSADRLSTHPDPAARRAAETIIVSIERIEARLRDA